MKKSLLVMICVLLCMFAFTAGVNAHTVLPDVFSLNDIPADDLTPENPVPWDGSIDTSWYNTEDKEFTLTTPAQLAGFAAIVNGTAEGISQDSFNGKTVKLGADITLNTVSFSFDKDTARVVVTDGKNTFYVASAENGLGAGSPKNEYGKYYANAYDSVVDPELAVIDGNKLTCNGVTVYLWTPIGISNKYFSGTFDGQGHSIHGLFVNTITNEETTNAMTKTWKGLFGILKGPAKNLELDGAVFGKGGFATQTQYNLENISADMYVMCAEQGNNKAQGGLIGEIYAIGNVSATNLSFRGVVSGETKDGGNSPGVGGITGKVYSGVTLEKSVNYGEVFANPVSVDETSGVGGIAGTNSGTIKYCVNHGAVGLLGKHHNIGGIVGYNSSTMQYCYNTGSVLGDSAVGGLVGFAKTPPTYCYNVGEITITGEDQSAYGSALGSATGGKNLYYSEESYVYDEVKTLDGVKAKTEAEMKDPAFAALLGSEFAPDKHNVNNGFPVFAYSTEESNEKQITSFKLGDIEGKINESKKTITVKGYNVPLDGSVATFKPEITVSEGATVSPGSGESAEFTWDIESVDVSKAAQMEEELPVVITLPDGTPLDVQWYKGDGDKNGTPCYYAIVSDDVRQIKVSKTDSSQTVKYLLKTSFSSDAMNGQTIFPNGSTLTIASNKYLTVSYKTQGEYYGDLGKTHTYCICFQPGLNYESKYTVTAENGSKTTYSVLVETFSDATGIDMDETASVPVGMTTTIPAVVKPVNAKIKNVTWSSDNEEIATVNAETGEVTGVAKGSATITAAVGDIKKECTVTVTDFISVEGISMENSITLDKRETYTLNPVFIPENASNKKITWSSDNEEVATVDKNGMVTGSEAGEATITAKTADGGIIVTCEVTVKELKVASVNMTEVKYVAVGNQKKLTAEVLPADAVNPEVVWLSSDESIATVEDGMLTGVSAGTVDITVRAKENRTVNKTITVTVCKKYEDVYDVQWAGVFNNNDANNSVTTGELPTDPGKVGEKWSAVVGNGSSVIVGDYVYTFAAASGMHGFELGGEPGTLYKVNKDTGEVVDSTTVGARYTSPLYYAYTIYGDGLIYASTPGGAVAFDPDTMEVIWETPNYNGCFPCAQFVNGSMVSNGVVYNGVTGKTTTCLKGGYDYSNGAVAGKYFYVADYTGTIHAFDTETWEEFDSLEFKQGGTVLQCGVAYDNGKLFWGDCMESTIHAVKINEETGEFIDESLQNVGISYTTTCTPVVYDGRVYLAGQVSDRKAVIGVFDADTLNKIYEVSNSGGKIQSTPILYADKENDTVYLYGQVYGGSAVYVLKDTGTDSGEFYKLTQGTGAMAFEQIACDREGALYVTDDSGILRKIVTLSAEVPQFTANLDKEKIVYVIGTTAEALKVEASVNDGGSLTYQWQQSTGGISWTDIEGATDASYVPATDVKGIISYRCVVKNTLQGVENQSISNKTTVMVVNEGEETITVTFRLIGATKSSQPVDFSEAPGEYYGSEYQNWIKTTTYQMDAGSTVYDVLAKALAENGMTDVGGSNGYVSSVTAPAVLGGETMSEFTNGLNSGWMYTINGFHPSGAGAAVTEYVLKDGDAIVFHYVNDYNYEDESTNPESEYLNKWLEVPDVAPGTSEDPVTPEDPKDEVVVVDPSELPFKDVKPNEWYADEVAYVYSYGLMNGTATDGSAFSPDANLNRAMMATILYRIEGEPKVSSANPFTDVPAGQWYTDAIIWAAENGIVKGMTETTYEPETDISREQMAVMMYRYAEFKGADISAADDLAAFNDAATVSYWAEKEIKWAVAVELINGMGNNTLAPQNTATRAQAATVLMRFHENILK